MKIFRFLLVIFIALYIILSLFQTQFDNLLPQSQLSGSYTDEAIRLAARSLASGDVPVGAVVIYEGKIIGRGFNTVNRDKDLTGHAEINALNDAVITVGLEKFNLLDRGKLIVVSTFEPCEMCKGAMVHYNIRKTAVMKEKSLWHWWARDLRAFWYEIGKKRTDGADKQDSLFMLHPDYPGRKK